MTARRLIGIGLLCAIVSSQLYGQDPSKAADNRSNRPATSGTVAPGVTVNPAQPYRPLPANATASRRRQTIFEFYLGALNPRKIQWGDEIDRRLAILAAQSVANPYFRACAFQTGVILILLLLCWVWWDKMRQIKQVAAEGLADVINAKLLADRRALEAISTYNRHIEMCNRVIEQQESGIAAGKNMSQHPEVQDLQSQLATERVKNAQLESDFMRQKEIAGQMEARVTNMEAKLREQRDGTNGELLARLNRAEAELATRTSGRK
ncbi:MAG: hypothetical protein ACRD7E_27075 [Bryobacteraceae bacterium]